MVCLLGCGRMAAMARLLKIGSFQEITPEEAIKQKIAAQIIHNELHDADEANLLEERDMHVFGYRPLTDPLHLVCCNACKKPIKASQYSAHAERCGLSNPLYDALENDDGSSPKKPPKKGKKIIQSTNGNLPVAVVDPDNSVTMDGIGVGGSAPSYGAKLQKKAVIGREVPANASTRYQSEAPTPLATKIYYSHGNHRLRLELQHIFYEMGAKDHGRDSLSPEVEQENDTISSQLPSTKFPYRRTREEFPQTKKDACNLAAMQSSDQMLLQSSELGFEKSRSLPSNLGNNTAGGLRIKPFS